MKKIKLVVFDLEGTLIRNSFRNNEFPSIWKVLCNLCGPVAAEEDAVNTRKYYAGEYEGYSYWVIDTIKILKKYGLKRKLFEDVIGALEYYPGVAETFAALRQQGIRCAIISGGLKALADRVAIDYQIDHTFASAEFYWNADDTMRHWNVMPTDFQHKTSLLSMLCHDLNINRNECAFIGDGRNDRDVAGSAGLSIGFNPHEMLRGAASIIIEQGKGKENLSAVIQPLVKYPFLSREDFAGDNIWKCLPSEPSHTTAAGKVSGTLSASGQRDLFHSFLTTNGLTEKSANSYCSYLNNLCKNLTESSWNGAAAQTAFSVLASNASTYSTEDDFILALLKPLAGSHGRENDSTSAAKQFWRFINGSR